MLDRLLGRAELKERIEELRAEADRLRSQLEAEQRRRADAVSERQEAQRRVNRLQDRIEELEDRAERAESGEDERDFRRTERLRGGRVGEVLDRLASVATGPEGAFTAVVADERDVPAAVRDAFGDRTPMVAAAAPCLAVTDDAGLVGACLTVPDPPAAFETWSDRFEFEREWFEPTGEFALALVRSDLFALGVYEGRQRRAFQGFDERLQRNHSKGGFSQARFERLRDEQIEGHLDRCREALADLPVDRLYVVGEATLLGEFEARADATAAVDATGDPEPALADAFREFWTVRLRTV